MTALTVGQLQDKLKELHQLTSKVPLFNPVFQLSHEISHELENGEVALTAIADLVSDLETTAIELRGQRLHARLYPVNSTNNIAVFRELVEATTSEGLDAFAALWAKPLMHIVFTAHPTFLQVGGCRAATTPSAQSGRNQAAPLGVAAPPCAALLVAARRVPPRIAALPCVNGNASSRRLRWKDFRSGARFLA